MTRKQKKNLIRIIVALVLFGAVFAAEKIIGEGTLPWYIIFPMYLVPYLVAGYDVLVKCVRNMLHGKLLDESFLMTVATVGAFALSLYDKNENEYAEAVFVMVFYQVGELFQSIAVGKSRKSIAGLMDIRPDTAVVIRDGEEIEVLPEEVEIGETILVKPGEKIPLDGTLLTGHTDIDTAALTGESVPVEKGVGDAVLSGSINLTAAITMRVEKAYDDSTVAKILELIENSGLNKAKTELALTKFARIYTPTVVGLALLLAVGGTLITKNPEWISRALIFLVVSCPCAIVISVPMAYFGGIGGASAKGILIKGSNYLEALADAGTFVFDKTGTLTSGQFSVTDVIPENGATKDELLRLAAAAETYSLHPIGLSVKAAAGEGIPTPESTENLSGYGVKAVLDGRTILAGNRALLEKENVAVSECETSGTVIFVAVDGVFIGRICIDDAIKENADAALNELRKNGVKQTVMLTGDNEAKAIKVGNALKLDKVFFSLLPADKVDKVSEMCENKQSGTTVAYVGDGINDAPVLARADVGIAMGGIGSDAAIEAADIVIMDDNIAKLPLAIRIARQTRTIVKSNITFALAVKVGVLILAAFGLTNMWVGVLADVGVAVLCILNSMRTLKQKD